MASLPRKIEFRGVEMILSQRATDFEVEAQPEEFCRLEDFVRTKLPGETHMLEHGLSNCTPDWVFNDQRTVCL